MFAANIVDGTVDSFNYLVMPEQHPGIQQYLVHQLGQFSNSLNDIGRGFIEKTREIYETVNSSSAIRMAKAAIRMAKGVLHPNTILPFNTLNDLRSAQPIMQRYLMAQPYIRELYHQQRCDGFSDTYVDVEPGKVGEAHYDYRRVMNGIVTEQVTEDGEDTWSYVTYVDTLKEGDRELVIEEQAAILHNWEIAKMFHKAGQDPTDLFGK